MKRPALRGAHRVRLGPSPCCRGGTPLKPFVGIRGGRPWLTSFPLLSWGDPVEAR